MARPERNNIDYFPHPVKHGKKMSYIERKYKNDGYAVWFKLLEELGDADYHFLDLSKNIQVMYLEDRCNVNKETLFLIINDLIELGEFNKELWIENQILFNEKFIESIGDAYKKRINKCVDKNSLLTLLIYKGILKPLKSNLKPSKSTSKGYGNTQRIGKDSIEEDRIVIPPFEDFKNYALENKPNIDITELKIKYEAWKVNGWKDGKNKKIINWKSKLLNTIPYLKENNNGKPKINDKWEK